MEIVKPSLQDTHPKNSDFIWNSCVGISIYNYSNFQLMKLLWKELERNTYMCIIQICFFLYLIHVHLPLLTAAVRPETRNLSYCRPGQKLRTLNFGEKTVCCYPTVCKPGQIFQLCDSTYGHDTCQNCPKGFTHYDTIDTSEFDHQIDPCIIVDTCEGDQKIINGECICDLTNGYYGRDKHNCEIDDKRCDKRGYELTIDGECKPCGKDHFKTVDNYELCHRKTRCSSIQEVDDEGSTTTDRKCRSKSVTLPSTFPKSSTTVSSRNSSTGNFDIDNNEPGRKEEVPTWIWYMVGAVVFLLCIGGSVVLIYSRVIPKVKDTLENGSDEQNPSGCTLIICCQVNNRTNTEMNFHATNMNMGDGNNMVVNNNSIPRPSGGIPLNDQDNPMTNRGTPNFEEPYNDVTQSFLGYAALNQDTDAPLECDETNLKLPFNSFV